LPRWGRHPSAANISCAGSPRAINRLGEHHRDAPVESARADLAKGGERVRLWLGQVSAATAAPPNMTLVTPPKWQSFHRGWQHRLNGMLVGRALGSALAAPGARPVERRVVLTTLPVAVAFFDSIDADAWVYYCVDDFSTWPGTEGKLMGDMERELVARVDAVVAASTVLAERIAAMGRAPVLLTHGVDLGHWAGHGSNGDAGAPPPGWWTDLRRPIVLFWGLIDRRLDLGWLAALTHPETGVGGSVVLVGPRQAHDPALARLDRVYLPGPVPYEALPILAREADVLVMPYADLPVTRAMQPLKLKEYLATGKPVVVRSLPATRAWADAADVVETAAEFVRRVAERAKRGAPPEQLAARRRLDDESWEAKAHQLEAILLGCL
jgi:glycosyltransferase involved in cell wall biosynthesis